MCANNCFCPMNAEDQKSNVNNGSLSLVRRRQRVWRVCSKEACTSLQAPPWRVMLNKECTVPLLELGFFTCSQVLLAATIFIKLIHTRGKMCIYICIYIYQTEVTFPIRFSDGLCKRLRYFHKISFVDLI